MRQKVALYTILILLLSSKVQVAYSQKKAEEAAYAVLNFFSNVEKENYLKHISLYQRSTFCVRDLNWIPFLLPKKRIFSGMEFKMLYDNLQKDCKSEKIFLKRERVKNIRVIDSFNKQIVDSDSLFMAFISHPVKVKKNIYYIDICVFIFVKGKLAGNELIVHSYIYDVKKNKMIFPEKQESRYFFPEEGYCAKVKEFERIPDLKKLFNNEKYMCW